MKKLFLICFILYASPCFAAIGLGGSTSGTADSTSLTISHTANASSNLVVIFIGNETGTQGRKPSSCTWDGNDMTLMTPVESNDQRNYAAICYIADSSTGTANAKVTMTGWCEITAVVADFTGVDIANLAKESDTTVVETDSTITNTLETTASNAWVIDAINSKDASPNFSAQSSQTTIAESVNSGGSSVISSYKLIASQASTDITWNHDVTDTQGQLISIYPSVAVAARRVMITE